MRIGVIGANGRVGTELCLYLHLEPKVEVVPICRNRLASTLLRRAGLECRHGALESAERARELLAGCDLVADFSLPQGMAAASRKVMHHIATLAIEQAPKGAPFVFASSMMAHGMAGGAPRFEPRWVARSVYGANKRSTERLARRVGARVGRPVYALRIGQVHGELQDVSREYLASLDEELWVVPAAPSYTVFVWTLAEALIQIAGGKEEPGTYTLISSPPWTWRELHEYFCRRAGVTPRLLEVSERRAGRLQRLASGLVAAASTWNLRHRELIRGQLLARFPGLEERAMARFYGERAGSEIAELDRRRVLPVDYAGPIPGPQLRSLSDARSTLEPRAARVRALLRVVAGDA